MIPQNKRKNIYGIHIKDNDTIIGIIRFYDHHITFTHTGSLNNSEITEQPEIQLNNQDLKNLIIIPNKYALTMNNVPQTRGLGGYALLDLFQSIKNSLKILNEKIEHLEQLEKKLLLILNMKMIFKLFGFTNSVLY